MDNTFFNQDNTEGWASYSLSDTQISTLNEALRNLEDQGMSNDAAVEHLIAHWSEDATVASLIRD